MIIAHKLDDFSFEIFPEIKSIIDNKAELENYFAEFYSYGSYKPVIKIENGIVIIDIDTEKIDSLEKEFKRALSFCEKGKYSNAKSILDSLLEKNPAVSEYHRIYGQILSDEGKQEEAIDHLIDALRWDPKNTYALLMMGNIFGKFKNDFDTSMKYYEQALKTNPEDNITLNNIGATLLQLGKIEESKKFFVQALKVNKDYPNTHYAMSFISEHENNPGEAFNEVITAMKKSKATDELYKQCINQAVSLAKKIISSENIVSAKEQYLLKLEEEGKVEVEIIEDSEIETAAKFEFAENYKRAKHRLLYNPKYPANEHLQFHELVHLDFANNARKENKNKLFVSTQQQKGEFIRSIESSIKKFKNSGYDEKSIANYCSALFNGINRQIFNTPIDLFIENFLFNIFPELRAYQFTSLYTLIKEGMNAVTNKKVIELSPKDVLSKSRIYNLVSAMQFRDLFGMDMIDDFKATNQELKQAQKFYSSFLEKKDNREPGEEYDLVQQWANDLKLENYFELINENEYRTKRTDLSSLLKSIEEDPFDLKNPDPEKEIQSEKFISSQKESGTNMAVVMYMVDALNYFEGQPNDKIKEAAFEIAMLGRQGIIPDKKGYKLSNIPGKEFSGFHLLAYYYVSWALAIPEMLEKLNLPYAEEYRMAEIISKTKK